MKQIRTRIREKRGSDYTETELQRLASAKLEQFADPSALRHDLLEQFRKRGDEPSTYHRHRGLRRLLLMMVHPLLKRVQKQLMADLNLYFEIIHNLVVEVTKLGVENHNLKMKVESLSSRLDFDERRARSLEGVVQYRQKTHGSDLRHGSGRPEQETRGGPRQDSDRPEREPRGAGSGVPRSEGRGSEGRGSEGRGPHGRPVETRGPAITSPAPPAATGNGTMQPSVPAQQSAAPSTGPSGPAGGSAPSGPASGAAPSGPSQTQGDGDRRRRRRRRRRRPGSTLADSPNAANTPQGGGAPATNHSADVAGDADDGDDGDEGAGNQ